MDLEGALADLKLERERIDDAIGALGTRTPAPEKLIAELLTEREQIEQAITSLEKLARCGARRRGRPPAWMARATAPYNPDPPLPPAAAMRIPQPFHDLVWAVSGRRRIG